MQTKIIEATNIDAGGFNYGKFMLGRFDDEEWAYRSQIDEGARLIAARGWSHKHLWVMDLQTGEGACFSPGGMASADLHKHRIWVCPMFEPFLVWLYKQNLDYLDSLPAVVQIDDARSSMSGYRRPGPDGEGSS